MDDFNFKKFIKKAKIENLIKSLICGIPSSILVDTLLIVCIKLLSGHPHIWLHCFITIILAVIFVVMFYKYVFVIKEEKIAKQIEKNVVLNEKVKTMIEYKNDSSPMAVLQREDAKQALEGVSVKQMKYHFSFSNFILAIISCASLVVAIIVPEKEVDPSAANPTTSESLNSEESSNSQESSSSESESSSPSESSSSSSGDGETDSTISDAIEDMKNDVDQNTGLDETGKEEIKDKLDDLQNKLENDETKEEQEQDIENTKQDIEESLDQKISKDEIGEALKNQSSTNALGDPIMDGNVENTNQSLDEIRDSLKDLTGEDLKNALNQLSQDIKNALSESGVDSSDSLYQAFDQFADNLNQNAQNVQQSDIQNQIDQSFEQAKEDISNALDAQNAISDLKDTLSQKLDDLKDALGSAQDGEKVPDDSGEQGDQGNDDPNGPGTQGSGEITYAEDDLIYDPAQNKYVTYGELINYYYDKVIGGTANGEIPEDVKKMIFEYFNSLYSDPNN